MTAVTARPCAGHGCDQPARHRCPSIGGSWCPSCWLHLPRSVPAQRTTSGGVVTEPAAQAALWCSRLWSDRPGRAVVGYGHSGHYEGAAYTFERFEQRDYTWPGQRQQLLEQALTAASTVDVYVSVLLRLPGTSGRRKDSAAPGSTAWADVDGAWTRDRQSALNGLGLDAWHVESGARGGRHVYLPLGQDVDPDQLEQLNRRLASALTADDGWERTKVLRLPGTLNHKPRPHGLPSAPVRWVA